MGNIKVRHLVWKPSGFYFQPSKSMKRGGFHNESLGKDMAGAVTPQALSAREIQQLIRETGRTPVQRDTLYNEIAIPAEV